MDVQAEEWRPAPGLTGYDVSDHGRIRSRLRGEPHVMKMTPGPCGFNTVTVTEPDRSRRTRRIGTLVALAWHGPRPAELPEVRRLNGDPLDDRPANLQYGTRDDVTADHAARARREEAAGAPTHCPNGYRYLDTWLGSFGERRCPCDWLMRVGPLTRSSRARYYARHADEINAQRRAQRAAAPARAGVCIECDEPIPARRGPGMLAWRCQPCRAAAIQASEKHRYHERRDDPVRHEIYRQKHRARLAARRDEINEKRRARTAMKPPRTGDCVDCAAPVPARRGGGTLTPRCDPCRDVANRARRKRTYDRNYARRRDDINAQRRARREQDRDKLNAQNKAYREKCGDELQARRRASREQNRDAVNAREREYWQANRERINAQRRARTAAKAPRTGQCVGCGQTVLGAAGGGSLPSRCDPCRVLHVRARNARKRDRLRDKINERQRQKYQANRETIIAERRSYREQNRDVINARRRANRAAA